ncbi:MAG: CbtA family protein [Proteobacteria bacterium]|nr:CbtA family protein [Pseudomonadota bacterium]
MFKRIFVTALLAGFLGGLGISVVQQFTTAPIILHAEKFESKGAPDGHKHSNLDKAASPHLLLAQAKETPPTEHKNWAPANGLERTLYSTLANILTGTGFALILVACIALSGRHVDGRIGVLWGIAGFTIINLSPALGLPPEAPGAMAAELGPRQGWWMFCVVATAAGLWALIFRHGAFWVVAGIVAMALPHLIGSPQPVRIGGPVPPELAGHFVAASLVTAAIFWSALGWLSGNIWSRLGAK